MWPSLDDIQDARASGTGGGIRIAILDSGIDENHPALQETEFQPAQAVRTVGHGFYVEACPPEDAHGHGTAIAGIISSVAPEAELLSIRVLDCRKQAHRHDVIKLGAMRAIELGAQVLNCSFGIPGASRWLPIYKSWTDRAFEAGRHVIAASSNADPDDPHWPASFPQVLAVTDANLPPDVIRHRPQRLVSFEAGGVDIPVITPGGGRATLTGSSFAAAHLSGLLARILSRFPDCSPLFAQEALRRAAESDTHPDPA